MFQPFIPSESADLLEGQFSVLATVVREFVEELYGVEELETGDGRVDPQAIYRRRESRLLNHMLKHGSAAPLYTGVGVNLLALRHEICTVLVIDDPSWYERECGELRICDEYLQQCQQTDLLPDQRWVQLISLDRHGLEMEPDGGTLSAPATSLLQERQPSTWASAWPEWSPQVSEVGLTQGCREPLTGAQERT